ncbi:electron transfer flavoprotein subunit alpha/FixB family protein [Pseudaminobacter arsenicus]|uniref:Electron transfer flavoprotein subunit alpha/FixB family protein n=1 Tax=Borborobacter arsenicus TaxID=1851146 RepID=A0A432VBG4_9HYPH|nr:electron transfer flavoprotein subunit alpha/FixB family protein [Pseudaminobacter arsenicus]RUM99507.1 electron transfer flavoprotein subunit alpha/FixB family protein [Pseudaminobacter arsenicus]
MADILVYIELVSGQPTQASLDLLSGARDLAGTSGRVTALAVEDDSAVDTAKLGAADRIVLVSGDAKGYTGERHLAALSEAIERDKPGIVLIANSYVGLDISTSVAARVGQPLLAYCVALALGDDTLRATCQIYGGKLEADVECNLPAIAAVNPGVFQASETRGAGEIVQAAAPVFTARTMVQSTSSASDTGVDITASDLLVCVGRGVGDEDGVALAQELADALGAELVASRPVVDQGWVEKSRQVGKSGKTVKPKLYLAVGVSGAPEHLEGMRDAGLIIAVNTDANAPIFDAAHFGTRCDVLEFLPLLTEKLQGAIA